MPLAVVAARESGGWLLNVEVLRRKEGGGSALAVAAARESGGEQPLRIEVLIGC